MKVKQPVTSSLQQPQLQIRREADMPDKASLGNAPSNTEVKADGYDIPGNSETGEDAHLLTQEEVDLAFERDEILQPVSHDNHMTSHSPKVWQVKGLNLKLSALEATVTVKRGVFTYDDFEV
jgi:hypothetical protein